MLADDKPAARAMCTESIPAGRRLLQASLLEHNASAPEDAQSSAAELLAHSISGTMAQLGKKAALFSHGAVAGQVAEAIQALPSRPHMLGCAVVAALSR
jgi:hypothetical protein